MTELMEEGALGVECRGWGEVEELSALSLAGKALGWVWVGGLSQVGWRSEAAADLLERVKKSFRTKEAVWGPQLERLGWKTERLVDKVDTEMHVRHWLWVLALALFSDMLKVARAEKPRQLRKLTVAWVMARWPGLMKEMQRMSLLAHCQSPTLAIS